MDNRRNLEVGLNEYKEYPIMYAQVQSESAVLTPYPL